MAEQITNIEHTPGTRMSRRDFLRKVVGPAVATAILGLLPGNPPPLGVGEPTEPSAEGSGQAAQKPAEAIGPPLRKEFAFQDVEGMEVLGAKQALSKKEFDAYVESRKGKEAELNPEIRTTEFLVGSEAWRSWQNDERMQGEHLPHFLRRHIERMNQVMERTRPESGISQMRMAGKIVVVDEVFLQTMKRCEKQVSCSADCFGRWPIEANYWPEGNEKLGLKPSGYLHKDPKTDLNYDDGLLHEWMHSVFYEEPHLFNFFIKFRNWKDLLSLDLPDEGLSNDDRSKQTIRLWQEATMNDQFRTIMLHFALVFGLKTSRCLQKRTNCL